jgi:hypothetical protein
MVRAGSKALFSVIRGIHRTEKTGWNRTQSSVRYLEGAKNV